MKVAKLIIGILCILASIVILFQSCAAGFVDAIEDNGGVSGVAGSFVAIMMLAGGIILIATRNSAGKGGDIANIVIFGLAALMGFSGAGIYGDLYIWSGICLVIAVICIISMVGKPKKNKTESSQADDSQQ